MSDYHDKRNAEVTRRTEAGGSTQPPQRFTHRHSSGPCAGEIVELPEGKFCIYAAVRVYSNEMIE